MIIKGYIILFFSTLFCACNALQAQKDTPTDSLAVLEVKNKGLLPILDSIIEHEKGCDYYGSDLIFFVDIQLAGDTKILQIGSDGFWTIRSENDLGLFEYGEHLFLVSGRYLDETLFLKTGEKKLITYEPAESYDEETGEVILHVIEDDSFSFWIYDYAGEKFILKDKHTFCE